MHRVVDDLGNPFSVGAMRATVELAEFFGAVSDDPAAAMRAGWRELVNRTLETVERMSSARHGHLKRSRVVVPTDIAFGHRELPGENKPIGRTVRASRL